MDNLTGDKTRYDLTSADTKIIGFDFQYFYFINELLKLNKGESIGYEEKDDVNIELPNNRIVLIQLKHTIKKNINGNPINLTNKDDDLWKTLSNWSKVICDKTCKRKSVTEQFNYVNKVEFILATNKSILENEVISTISKVNSKKISFDEFKKYLSTLVNKTKDSAINQYINDIACMNNKVLKEFIKNIKFIDTGDDLISEIKLNIQRKMIAENRVNDVFNDLYSELKQNFFECVKNGQHQIITFDEWVEKYTCVFEKSRETTLPIRRFKPMFPNDLTDQPFIKELIEIGEVSANELSQIVYFSDIMLGMQMNLEKWHTDGEVTGVDISNFHKEAISIWRNTHKSCHRGTKRDLSLNYDNALKCLDNTREKNLKIITTEVGIDLSNGEFYCLSNKGNIGWKLEWEEKY